MFFTHLLVLFNILEINNSIWLVSTEDNNYTNLTRSTSFCMTEFDMAYHHNVVVKRKKRLIVLMMLDSPIDALNNDCLLYTSDAADE